MNIIILGSGQVGSSIAEILSKEENDITVVDKNQKILQTIRDRMDIRTVHGDASSPEVLAQAGAETGIVTRGRPEDCRASDIELQSLWRQRAY